VDSAASCDAESAIPLPGFLFAGGVGYVAAVNESTDVEDIVELANDLRAIILRLARHLRSEAHASGLTGGQIAILVAIEFNPGVTARKLALREGLSGPGVSGHLARLEGLGMLYRQRRDDGSGVGLYLTSGGSEIVATVRGQRTAWLVGRLEELSPEDRAQIRESLAPLDRVSMGDR
jgi:DNA-binding MarR family transcriptional regulator